ncbi:hypothetical protein ACHAXN_008885 [Cyclotella atomus]
MVGIQDRQLDFEDFSTDTEKISAILKRIEVSSQKHKLTHEYYRARKFLLLSPAILCCCAIGILGFVVTTEAIKDHMHVGDVKVEDVLTILTGCLGFFVGVVLLLGNQWDFGARECMHWSAMIELDKLGDKVRFWKMDRANNREIDDLGMSSNFKSGGKVNAVERKALGVVESPDTKKMALVVASGKILEKVESEIEKKTREAKAVVENRTDVSRFSGFNGAYHQILASCKSTIPNGIHRPFDLFESRLECQSLGHLGVVWDTRMRRNQIMRLGAIEIYNEISSFWLWPLATPDIDAVIDRSMRRVARLVSKDYRAPVKVRCFGFTLMRCCCRKRSGKNNAVDNIFKGMEMREGEIMEARGLTDYMAKGDNKRGEYLLEDDAYSADMRSARRDDDSYTSYYSQSTRGDYSMYSKSGYSRGGSYSKSSYSRGGYLEDGRGGYLEDGQASEYSKSKGWSKSIRGGSYSRGSASYSGGSASYSKGSASNSRNEPSPQILPIRNGEDDSYSKASQSRGGSVYTEDGDSFTKEVAAAQQYSQSRSRPQSSASRHMSSNSRLSKRSEPSGHQYGVSGEFSDGSSSFSRESIHWDEASESQYSPRR